MTTALIHISLVFIRATFVNLLWMFREKELTMMARSARDAHLHKALFLPGGLADGTELGYYRGNQVLSTKYLLLTWQMDLIIPKVVVYISRIFLAAMGMLLVIAILSYLLAGYKGCKLYLVHNLIY